MFKTNKYAKEFSEPIEELKKKLKTSLPLIGQFVGYELLTRKSAGESMVLLTLIAKHEKEALIYRILYYRPGNEWQVQDIKYNRNIGEELEEASRAYRFKENLED